MPYKNRELDYHLTPVGWTRSEIASAYTIETWRLKHLSGVWVVERATRVAANLAQHGVVGDRARKVSPDVPDANKSTGKPAIGRTAISECRYRAEARIAEEKPRRACETSGALRDETHFSLDTSSAGNLTAYG